MSKNLKFGANIGLTEPTSLKINTCFKFFNNGDFFQWDDFAILCYNIVARKHFKKFNFQNVVSWKTLELYNLID